MLVAVTDDGSFRLRCGPHVARAGSKITIWLPSARPHLAACRGERLASQNAPQSAVPLPRNEVGFQRFDPRATSTPHIQP
jgi:hypothetical protein